MGPSEDTTALSDPLPIPSRKMDADNPRDGAAGGGDLVKDRHRLHNKR
jgi:hypothetical protein